MSKDQNSKPKQIPTVLVKSSGDHRTFDQYNKYFFTPACKFIRKALANHLKDKREQSVEKSDKATTLELPSYSEKQAYESGYRAALKDILELIDR